MPRSEMLRALDQGGMSQVQWQVALAPSVEMQMADDDLFDLAPRLRDTAEPQAPVSPDKENQFPTADQDDTRQSAHVSDTLIPNSACRLSRSWGAV
jgi:hypothetical protein